MAEPPCGEMELTAENLAENELAAILNDGHMCTSVDIDKTLNDKAQKSQLTKTNVKNLIKNVLMNDDVATMLRQTLDDDGSANCLYEPKLTRAKIREMLKNYPSVHQSPYQQSIISECRLLIEKEFPDDSDDEEYQPDKNLEDDDDDDESKCTEVNKSFDNEGDTENEVDSFENTSNVDTNDKETIGMRTRSKFSLNDTPLEIIEQAFIPPDITEDMYDSACENDEWMEFLSEFTKPLELVQNDDGEDDPEYNVLCDDDFSNVDKEEFRIDKSVKVTRREYNDLMNELYEFTESYLEFNGSGPVEMSTERSSNSNKNVVKHKNSSQSIPVYTSNSSDWKSNATCPNNESQLAESPRAVVSCSTPKSTQLQNSIKQSINDQLKINYNIVPSLSPIQSIQQKYQNKKNAIYDRIVEKTNLVPKATAVNSEECGMSSKQIILLKQQLNQHTQLITQNYLLCTMAKKFKLYCRNLKIMLVQIKDFSRNKIYAPININSSLEFIQDWSEGIMNMLDINRDYVLLPSYAMEFILFYEKPVFIYPKLLPCRTYRLDTKNHPIEAAEETVLVFKIDYVYTKLKESSSTKAKNKNKNLSDLLPLVLESVQKRWFKHRKLTDLKKFITLREHSVKTTILKSYLTDGVIEPTKHVVNIEAFVDTKCLYQYDIKLFPTYWKTFVKQSILQKCT